MTLNEWLAQFTAQPLDLESLSWQFEVIAIGLAMLSTWLLVLALNGVKRSALLRSPVFQKVTDAIAPIGFLVLLWLGLIVAQAILVYLQKTTLLIEWVHLFFLMWLLWRIARLYLHAQPIAASALRWVVIPLLLLNQVGVLPIITATLEQYAIRLGNIDISLYDVIRLLLFGALLFWIGRLSNRAGKQVIRKQQALAVETQELMAKLWEVALYFVIFLVLLNVLGINLTTLAVFGGALGVGLGFGLQSIAANFISGIIILLDQSLKIGDYIELDDGRSGRLRELNLRSATLETFDGKDIVVPNEVFISTSFTNWTHKNKRQRYALHFSIAYSTDLDVFLPLVKQAVAAHPKVLSGDDLPIEEQADAEIAGFGDNGIDILVEFWIEAIDDGQHRVGADVLYAIWKLVKEHGFEFPFPQREVRLLNTQNEKAN